MFLAYCDVFRDYTDPIKVTEYYFENLRNGEWFLTYRIYNKDSFDTNKVFRNFIDYYFPLIEEIKIDSIEMKDNLAFVQAQIIYNDASIVTSVVELQKEKQIWRIHNVKYKI